VPSRRRRALFALLLAACLLGAAAAIAAGVRGGGGPVGASSAARDALATARAQRRPALVFRSGTGELAVAALGAAPGPRRVASLRCDRVDFAGGRGLCLTRGSGFAAGYEVEVLDGDLRVVHRIGVTGIPSRARVSPDGRHGAVTFFVAGHAYAAAGSFSTRTTLLDLVHGTELADLESFEVTRGGRLVTARDMNFWGVTFARDGDRFYATLATGGRTYLIAGSLRTRTARVVHENVECPSLSPDGTRVAYKRRTGSRARPWRLSVLDLATMRETPLAETRSVDDQAAWRDDGHVLYGLGGAIWEVRADGGGRPRRLLAGADSPAVVRF
jgi:hypothetical protein